MSPAIAPPIVYQTPTASSARAIVEQADNVGVYEWTADLVEEPMDYTPIATGRLAAPGLEDETWVDDDSGPMGF
jgi:hypothetical protein